MSRRLCIPVILIASSILGCSAGDGTPASAPPPASPRRRAAVPVWKQVDDMSEPRSHHIAVVLDDGRVLVAGGFNSEKGALSSAEIYDPYAKTSPWTPARAMHQSRWAFAATLLPNHKVLVSGGVILDPDGVTPHYLDSAELYDPKTNTWTETPSMVRQHVAHTSTLLNDKRVLVVGGRGTFDKDIAEIYDPDTNQWSITRGPPSQAHHEHTASLMPDGSVLIIGGYDPYAPLGTIESYDPVSRTFQDRTPMKIKREGHIAMLLNTGPGAGRVLVAGGMGGGEACYKDGAEISDTSAGEEDPFMLLMHEFRANATGTMLGTGEVLIAGGECVDAGRHVPRVSVEAYDPEVDTFRPTPSMHFARASHTATPISTATPMGVLTPMTLVVGGDGIEDKPIAAVEIFYRNGHCASAADCSDGVACDTSGSCVELLDPSSDPGSAQSTCTSAADCLIGLACSPEGFCTERLD